MHNRLYLELNLNDKLGRTFKINGFYELFLPKLNLRNFMN